MSKEAKKEQKEVVVVQFTKEDLEAIAVLTDGIVKAYGYQDHGQWLQISNHIRQKIVDGEKKEVDA